MIVRVTNPNFVYDTDNPDADEGSYGWSGYIPANNNILTKATQFMCLISYCVFADESLKDLITAVETFPKFSRVKQGDKVQCMVISSILRGIQGLMATTVVMLLVVTSSDVVEIILNFTALNFISVLDDVGFELGIAMGTVSLRFA